MGRDPSYYNRNKAFLCSNGKLVSGRELFTPLSPVPHQSSRGPDVRARFWQEDHRGGEMVSPSLRAGETFHPCARSREESPHRGFLPTSSPEENPPSERDSLVGEVAGRGECLPLPHGQAAFRPCFFIVEEKAAPIGACLTEEGPSISLPAGHPLLVGSDSRWGWKGESQSPLGSIYSQLGSLISLGV